MASNTTWVKSSYSGGQGGNCVEVARPSPTVVAVRDSKHPHGAALAFGPEHWRAFTRRLKNGETGQD